MLSVEGDEGGARQEARSSEERSRREASGVLLLPPAPYSGARVKVPTIAGAGVMEMEGMWVVSRALHLLWVSFASELPSFCIPSFVLDFCTPSSSKLLLSMVLCIDLNIALVAGQLLLWLVMPTDLEMRICLKIYFCIYQ